MDAKMIEAISGLDERYGYRHLRYNSNEAQRKISQERNNTFWNHASPNSIYVAAMGNHWTPGSWQKVCDMVQYTNDYGYLCVLEEIMDRCHNPYDALGTMRNEAIMRASEGYDWLLYLDNDVYPAPDFLVRMIDRDVACIAPYVIEPGTGKLLHGPHSKLWQGLQPARWTVLSMLLFRVNVFHKFTSGFWENAIGADEGFHFQKLWHEVGHRPFIDTDLWLPVGKEPTYPLSTNRMKEEDSKSFWDKRRDWLNQIPDRKPINPAELRITANGEYLPFIQPVSTAQAAEIHSRISRQMIKKEAKSERSTV